MEDRYTFLMRERTKCVDADRKEAIVFLAAIIPKEERESIRSDMENDPKFGGIQHMFFGMRVRNALRMGGFFYDPHLMDCIWFPWLRAAVSLPEEEIVLSDSIRDRIRRYHEALDKNAKQEAAMRDTLQKPLVRGTVRWVSERTVILSLALTALFLFLLSLVL